MPLLLVTNERNAEWYVVIAALIFKLVYGIDVICRRVGEAGASCYNFHT